MTHEELLANIDGNSVPIRACVASLNKALRTVVELHKPVTPKEGMFKNQKFCSKCERMFYPCPTIQAIEKALNDRD